MIRQNRCRRFRPGSGQCTATRRSRQRQGKLLPFREIITEVTFMDKRVRVTAATTDTCPGQIDANLAKIDLWTSRAAAEGARLVMFPELSLTGFIPNHPTTEHEPWLRRALAAARRTAIRVDGPEVAAAAQIAARHDVLVSVGILEDAGNVLYKRSTSARTARACGPLAEDARAHVRDAFL